MLSFLRRRRNFYNRPDSVRNANNSDALFVRIFQNPLRMSIRDTYDKAQADPTKPCHAMQAMPVAKSKAQAQPWNLEDP